MISKALPRIIFYAAHTLIGEHITIDDECSPGALHDKVLDPTEDNRSIQRIAFHHMDHVPIQELVTQDRLDHAQRLGGVTVDAIEHIIECTRHNTTAQHPRRACCRFLLCLRLATPIHTQCATLSDAFPLMQVIRAVEACMCSQCTLNQRIALRFVGCVLLWTQVYVRAARRVHPPRPSVRMLK